MNDLLLKNILVGQEGKNEDARGFRCTLKRRHVDCAGPPPIWMHGCNCVSDRPELDEAHPGGGASAITLPFLCVSTDLLWWRIQKAVRMAGLAAMRWVCLRQLPT